MSVAYSRIVTTFLIFRWSEMEKKVSLEAMHSQNVDGFEETRQIMRHKFLPPFALTARYFVRIVKVVSDRSSNNLDQAQESDEEYRRKFTIMLFTI